MNPTTEGRKNIVEFLRSFDPMMRTTWMERTLEMQQKLKAAANDVERVRGFTRDDVDFLRSFSAHMDDIAEGPMLASLADRIEALLPPEGL